ncbi:peroxiredoxin-like family protein [Geminicoccus roseus]|uniref:peroxiredoxin-like family protein n=1 Tax=Geminicoccus roseus TaxID=404900 RepID=UPI0004072BF4|nr:peroxiredoxin-like family protein [Geminicoccus roseus]
MTDLTPLFPRQKVPGLSVPLAGGGTFDLADEKPGNFTLVVFYRGLHCPICKAQLLDLQSKIEAFESRGVSVIAISSDDAERAERTQEAWHLDKLRVGYGLDLKKAREWGLFISSGRGKTSAGIEEPARFSEPGLFLVRPDGTLYFSSVQTMPFARPALADILGAVDFVLKADYPARGEIESL